MKHFYKVILLICFLVATQLRSIDYQNKDYPRYRYDENNTGYIPIKSPLKYSTRAWIYRTLGKVVGSPISVDKRLYFGDLKNVFYCVDAETGDTIWAKQLSQKKNTRGITGSPIVYQDKVIVVNGDGFIYGFNRINGTLKWGPVHLKAPVHSSPVIIKDFLFIVTLGDGFIWVLNPENGEFFLKQNNIATGFPIHTTPIITTSQASRFNISKSKHFFELIVTVPSRLMVFHIQIEPDRVRQLKDILIEGTAVSSPVQYENRIFFATRQRLYCVDRYTYDTVWIKKLESFILNPLKKVYLTPVTDGKIVYYGKKGYDLKTGSAVYHIWNYGDLKTDLLLTKNVLFTSGEYTLYGKTQGYLAGLSRQSANLYFWRDLYTAPLAAPIIANDMLFITTENKDLIAFQ